MASSPDGTGRAQRGDATTTVATEADGIVVSAPLVERELARWKSFLEEQERLCTEHGFRAAMVTIGVDSADDLPRAIAAVGSVLRSTDRAGVLCDTELAVLLMPLESIHHAQRLVHVVDGALRAEKVPSHVGWAMRLEGQGLFQAAARADAAMGTARRHGQRGGAPRTPSEG
ncbi:MAG TPA: hypothetical protein VF183_16505 [Acidimicrobiales bacterium]